MTEAEPEPSPKLVRELGPIDATMIVMGSMIGSGIFITSAESARLVGSPGWLLAAWAIAGLLTITGALCAAEVAAMMPRAGGQYVFLREAYGPSVGFLFGWATFLVVQTGTIAAVAVAFAKFLGVLVPAISADRLSLVRADRAWAARATRSASRPSSWSPSVLIALLTAVNTRGLRTGKAIQNTFTFTKTAALIALIVVGIFFGANRGAAAWTSSWWSPSANGWTAEGAQKDLGVGGHAGVRPAAGQGDDRPAVLADRLEQRDLHRRRGPRPGPDPPEGAGLRLRDGGRALPAGQRRVPGDAARSTRSRTPSRAGSGTALMKAVLGPIGRDGDGRGDHDLDLRLRQRPGPLRGPGPLRDGPRRPVLPEGRHDQRPPRPGRRPGRAGGLGDPPDPAGDGRRSTRRRRR